MVNVAIEDAAYHSCLKLDHWYLVSYGYETAAKQVAEEMKRIEDRYNQGDVNHG